MSIPRLSIAALLLALFACLLAAVPLEAKSVSREKFSDTVPASGEIAAQLVDVSWEISLEYDECALGELVTGEQFDENTKLTYLRARWLNNNTGRFMTADPHPGNPRMPLTLNDYLYAESNPVNKQDPTGLATLLDVLGGSGLVNSITPISLRGLDLVSKAKIWKIYVGVEPIPGEIVPHAYMVAQGLSLIYRYDRGAADFNEAKKKKFTLIEGGVGLSRISIAELKGKRAHVTSMSSRQWLAWTVSVLGPQLLDNLVVHNGIIEGATCDAKYRLIPGPNCYTWTAEAIAKALVISRFNF